MSKVYEALQQAYENQREVIKIHPIEERPRSQPVVVSNLPPLKMRREMVQLEQRLAGLFPDPHHNIVQFISSRNQEGVSTIVQEFGRVLVEKQGKSVLLVDGDSQKITQHQFFGIPPKTSLQYIMRNGGDLDQAITPVLHSRLFLALLSGNTSETVHHEVTTGKQDLWTHIRKQFDMIIIDTAPIDISDEGLELCAAADGVVMVVEAEKTRAKVISHLKDRIVQNGGNLLGMVFNKQHHYIPKWIYRRL
ncbi:CpsD/CapB family tyrosine-protein kinase [Nitrospira sp. T9]|uniref:CpsD/CapB family tyrosine-protein kinase n=1 Tax=unclassified Nitrospira TaxID=2652172 RepID=UPI003F998D26